MRRKKLLTTALCSVIALASCTVNSTMGNLNPASLVSVAYAADSGEETESADTGKKQKTSENKNNDNNDNNNNNNNGGDGGTGEVQETKAPETQAAETQPSETQAPETQATETQPSETQPPETQPVETQPAETQATETQKPSETTTESSGGEQSGTEQLPSETAPIQTETAAPDTELLTEATPGETLPTESETAVTESETEKESETEESETGSNEELIAKQNIVIPPDIELEFRFTQVDKAYAVVSNRSGAKVYEEKSADSREVGELEYYGSCCILEDAGDGWYYVESGNVRGFLAAEDAVAGETAERIVKIKGLENLPEARLLVARTENEAFDYTHTTTQEVMAEKVYALADGAVSIYEQRKETARETGRLSDQSLCYILADSDKEWVFVESGDARGFVKKSSLITGSAADSKVEETGEKNMSLAEVLVEPSENKACYYTLTSVKKASQSALTREAMVNFALQFVGNPYVWGGTSLTNGADCSGFVQSVYAYFGYSLPRVAENQATYGMQIPIESAEPGDLIFYARNGYVYHVSMYIGNGQVVHAAGRKVGIITSGIGGNAVWATRVITD